MSESKKNSNENKRPQAPQNKSKKIEPMAKVFLDSAEPQNKAQAQKSQK